MEFFSEEIRITIQIILIDLVLSADNAVIIGMAASQFDPAIRKKVLIIGTGFAVVFRILFSAMTAYLMQFQGIRTIGGILLLWVSYKLYVDILKKKEETKDISKYQVKESEKSNFRKAVTTVIIADLRPYITWHLLMLAWQGPQCRTHATLDLIFHNDLAQPVRFVILDWAD